VSPAQDAGQGGSLHADPRQPRQLGQALQPRLGHGLGGRITIGHSQGDLCSENIIKATCIAGQKGLEMLEDLAAEQAVLLDQIAAMAGQQLQGGVEGILRGLLEPEAMTAAKDSHSRRWGRSWCRGADPRKWWETLG
jgi:hypothetical protein